MPTSVVSYSLCAIHSCHVLSLQCMPAAENFIEVKYGIVESCIVHVIQLER